MLFSGNGYSGIGGTIPRGSIPPAGTSARKAYEKTQRQGSGQPQTVRERLLGTYSSPVKDAADTVLPVDPEDPKDLQRKPYRPSPGRLRPPSARRTWDYYEAPLAEKYGFGKATAYQEALANTAYRREMDDMRKAGLNPSVIYGSHNTSGADSSIIPRDGSGHSGGSGGYIRRSRGGNSGKYLFSGGSYYGIMAAVGAMTALATHNVGAGMAAAGLTGTALKAFNGFAKRK